MDNLSRLNASLNAELHQLKLTGKAKKSDERKVYFQEYYQRNRHRIKVRNACGKENAKIVVAPKPGE